jgi:hypothetical protein
MNHEAISVYNEIMKCKSKVYNIKELAYNIYLLKCGFRKIYLTFINIKKDTREIDKILDKYNIFRICSSALDSSVIFTNDLNSITQHSVNDKTEYKLIGKLLGYDSVCIKNFYKDSDIPSYNYSVSINNVHIYNFVCNGVKDHTGIVKRLQLKVNKVSKLLKRDNILNKNGRESVVKFKVEPFNFEQPKRTKLRRSCKKMKFDFDHK